MVCRYVAVLENWTRMLFVNVVSLVIVINDILSDFFYGKRGGLCSVPTVIINNDCNLYVIGLLIP